MPRPSIAERPAGNLETHVECVPRPRHWGGSSELHNRRKRRCFIPALTAKNKLTTNYLYLAEKLGAAIHELHEVYDLVPLEGGGFEVHARHPGWA